MIYTEQELPNKTQLLNMQLNKLEKYLLAEITVMIPQIKVPEVPEDEIDQIKTKNEIEWNRRIFKNNCYNFK